VQAVLRERLIQHSIIGSRGGTSISFAGALVLAGIAASIGLSATPTNALAETTIGLFKNEAVLPAIPTDPNRAL
jgi:hypothetical protein